MSNRKTTVFLSIVLIAVLVLLFVRPCTKKSGAFSGNARPIKTGAVAKDGSYTGAGKDNTVTVPVNSAASSVSVKPIKVETAKNPVAAAIVNFNPFFVYKDNADKDNHFVPSGFMGNVGALSLNFAYKVDPQSGKNCIRVIYNQNREGMGWAGVYWTQPADNWGDKGSGYNLTGAKKLTFWAKGEKGGEIISNFIVGGIQGKGVEDSDSVAIGPIELTKDWQQYTIYLNGADLRNIIGGFCFTVTRQDNPDGATFYLDNIVYE